MAEFEKAGAQVLGVSIDSFAAAGEFERKLGLGFPLLSDFPNGDASRAYGAYDEERKVARRFTFVIGRDRVIRWRYDDGRDFAGHAEQALQVLSGLEPA